MSYAWPKSLPSCESGITSRPHLAVSDGVLEREESIDDDGNVKRSRKQPRVTQEGVYRSIDPVDKAARIGRRL